MSESVERIEPNPIHIRAMRVSDIPAGIRLKQAARWNQTYADWQRFLALEPGGGLVAIHNDRVIGTITTCSFQTIAWIGMLLVDPAWRRRGIATRLMNASLEQLTQAGFAGIYLDATELGAPLYRKLGFQSELEVVRFGGRVSAGRFCKRGVRVRPFRWLDLASLTALDRLAAGVDRTKLLKRLLVEESDTACVVSRGGRVEGFVLDRPGSRARFVGPLVARSEAAGQALLADALARNSGSPLMMDLPAENEAALALAREAGLEPQRKFLRMVLGSPAGGHGAYLWAGSGPEKG